MTEDIFVLCSNLPLTDKEKFGVEIAKWGASTTINCGCKVIADNSINLEALMVKVWKILGSLSISDVGKNLFVLEFQFKQDLLRVRRGCPWMIDRHLFVLKDFDGYTPI